jgi:KDO2-lipid IV(A) lauroyltransferase
LWVHRHGITMHSVYRSIKNPLIDRLIRRRRAAFGQIMVEREGAFPTLLRILRRKGYIGLVVDQYAKLEGIWVPFFGRLASTTPGPALLALRAGAPIVIGFARRLPGLYRFEIFFDEPIWAAPSGDRDADVERITLEISRRIEGYVRQAPEQWLWLHRRWRRPPWWILAKGTANVGSPGEAD